MRASLPTYQNLIAATPEVLRESLQKSPEEAARWVEAAAHNGVKSAIINWGQMLLDGYGVKRDAEAALRWFRIAAETGYPDGINMLGRCHEHGWGTPVDVEEAARCYNVAAALGHDFARFNLGMLFVTGNGIRRDLKTALTLFVGSARQGNAKAMNMIGRYCEEGWNGRVRLQAASRWYARAAMRGCFRGQFHLARFLAASGNIPDAVGWLRHSLNAAPADFCREAADMLERYDTIAIRDLAALARSKARYSQGPRTQSA